MSTSFPLQRINRWARVADPTLLPGVAAAEINLHADDLCTVGPVFGTTYIDYICTNPSFPATWASVGFCCGTDPMIVAGQTLYLDEVEYYDFNNQGYTDWWSQLHVAAPGDTSQPLDVVAQPLVANRPTETFINGYRAARFDGTTQWMVQQFGVLRSLLSVIDTSNWTLELAIVVNSAPVAATPQTGAAIFSSNDVAFVLGVFNDAGVDYIGMYTQGASDNIVVKIPVTLGKVTILTVGRNAGTGALSITSAGVTDSALAQPANLAANSFVVGARTSAGAGLCHVDIATISAHGALTAGVRADIEAFLRYKYVIGPANTIVQPSKPVPIDYTTVASITGIFDENGQTFVAGALTTWANQKGGGKSWNTIGGGGPALVVTATTFNGLASLSWPGTNNKFFLGTPAIAYADFLSAHAACVLSVINKPANGSGTGIQNAEAVLSDINAEGFGNWYTSGGVRKKGCIIQNPGNHFAFENNGMEFGVGYFDIEGYDGATMFTGGNGTMANAVQGGDVTAPGQLVLGANYGGGGIFSLLGNLGCMLTFGVWPGWATIQGIRSFCATKWNVT